MRKVVYVVIGIAVLVLSGCATPQRDVKIIGVDKITPSIVIYPSDLRGAYVLTENSNLKFCAEPVPDVALESIQKITANLKATFAGGQPIDASVSGELAIKAVELAGRTQLLLIAREMLYRACELSLNQNANVGTALDMYKSVVNLIKDLGDTEKNRATAELNRSQTALENAKRGLEKIREKNNK
jgi:hypothetical protein